MTTAARTSRWARRFVFAGACWFVIWQLGVLLGVAQRTGILLGLLGFVFHTVFGKAYSLLPTYFDSQLVTTRFLGVHLAAASGGTVLLAVGLEASLGRLRLAGAATWLLAVLIFVATLGATIRGNLTGAATGTADAESARKPLDRLANRFVPVVLCYLLVGSYGLLALESGLPALFDGYPARISHLLGAGVGALLIFSVGFRLLPRFFVAGIERPLGALVLTTGAIAPIIVAVSMPDGSLFAVGAVLQATAIVGYALAVGLLFTRSDRDRVGLYGVVAGAAFGVLGVALALSFVVEGFTGARALAHARLMLVGLLGLTIIGVSYQFYPPGVSSHTLVDDRTALLALGLLTSGLLVETTGLLGRISGVETIGRLIVLLGAAIHLSLLGVVFGEW